MYDGVLTEITGDSTEDVLRLQRMLEGPKAKRNNIYTMKKFKKEHLELYLKTLSEPEKRSQSGNVATITWDSGPKVTSQVGRALEVDFLVDGESVYKHTLEGVNHWCKPSIEYWQNWTVMIDGVSHSIDNDATQIIQFDSSSLGDTISWVEPCLEFKKLHNIDKLYIATHKNWLFDIKHYEDLGVHFIQPGEWPEDALALWRVGVYMEDVGGIVHFTDKNPRDWRKIYLGDIASDILGVYQTMRAPKLTYSGTHKQDKPYICIATASTAQAKYWNNPNGWQELINHYNSKGYDVYHISKEETDLRGLKKAPEGLDKVYKLLQGAELFYGISSGLTWFAWATDVPIVLISGFTPAICEFQDERTLRIINEDVCNSCWFRHHFDRADWNWCPDHKGTERMFECTKTITAQSVIKQVESFIVNLNKIK
jgi:autotransporter strand-loop-strand O-heptosyltransferase